MTWIADPNNMIGTVVGNTSTDSYGFILRSLRAKVGDIVATVSAIPDDAKSHKNAIIWGRIVSIDRHNPFFPAEAAQELAEQNLRLIDTVLSTSRDYLNAEVLILGSSDEDASENLELSPLTYPVQPAARVINPPAATIKKLLGAAQDNVPKLHIGTLLGRADVEVSLAANKVVSRHLAILAMTGGGKTVAARRVILALIDHGYPIVIFDPHGDYLGLYENRSKLPPGTDVKLFYPMMKVSEENVTLVSDLLAKMGKKMSEAQHDFFSSIVAGTKVDNGTKASDYIQQLIEHAERIAANIARKDKDGEAEDTPKKFGAMTVNAVKRSLIFVLSALRQMEQNNKVVRERLSDYVFDEMPDPKRDPEEIVRKKQVSIFYLAGYDHLTQSTIVSMVLDALFSHRASLTNRIPPFQTVIEEAHNFIPSRQEGTDETPSLGTVRKVITEGRKFGTGLMIISQRPARLDETILTQCNSFLVLRLVNPKDKNFVRSVMENLSESDANILQTFGPGQGIVSGQAVRFPLLVKVQLDKEFESSKIGDEDFLKAAAGWNEGEARSRNQGIFTATTASEKPATASASKPQDKAAKPGRQQSSELKFSAISKRKR
ncbi:ATP-binding protein [Bradyrhizobium sp. USDA 3458]|uniref:ATP-binding protein n=1 Tax=Bradyrhizobium sp. USDA 3458 TaxID=2591461 RepID=UPI0011450F48|nr:ATP-binding protein [Bradyrhizobium sp. USDA 3458]